MKCVGVVQTFKSYWNDDLHMNPHMYNDVRKLEPKLTLTMVGGSLGNTNEVAEPNDGYSWRKYGQKAILGARFHR